MTQTIQVETCSVSAPVGKGGVPQADSPGAEGDASLFAQLLAIAQNLTVPEGQGQPAVLPVDNPTPEQHEPSSADEITQMVASLGLPVLAGNVLLAQPVAIPVENTPDGETPRLPMRVAFLPQVATDAPVLTHPPAETEPTPAKGISSDAATFQTPLAAEDADVSFTTPQVNPIGESTRSASETPVTVALPLSDEVTSVALADLMPKAPPASEMESAVPLAPEAQRSSQNTTEKAQAPSEVSPSVAELQNPISAPAQASNAGQPLDGRQHERQNATLATPGSVRPQAKRSAAFGAAEKVSPLQPAETHLHHIQGVETASAMHRVQETVARPPEVSPTEVVRQVAQQVETMVNTHNTSSVTLQLEPEHLGRLRVTISFSDGAIHTHIVADNHAVRQMLESNSALLQQALQERGLQLGALQVSVQGDGRQFFTHQPYTSPSHGRGWLEAEPVWSTAETSFGRRTPGGINLLV